MRGTIIAVLILATALAVQLTAQTSDCSDGVVYDDGSFENAYGADTASLVHYVMQVTPPATATPRLGSVCICWNRMGTDSSISFNLRVWDSDGPGGSPGTLLGAVDSLQAIGIPTATPSFFRYDLSTLGVQVDRPIYVGPQWDAGTEADFFVCADEDGPTTQPAFVDSGMQAGSVPPQAALGTAGAFPDYRNLGLRAVFEPPACTPDVTTLCLPANDRFRVSIYFETVQGAGNMGDALAISLDSQGTTDGGLFYFVNPMDPQFLVKVVNGCPVNDRWWVFYAATTNVGFELTVTDTVANMTRTYTNPDVNAADTVTDIQAFATCP